MNIEGNVQLIEACLKTKSELTQRVIYNICDDTIKTIPYGVLDYAPMVLFGGIFIALIALLVVLLFQIALNK